MITGQEGDERPHFRAETIWDLVLYVKNNTNQLCCGSLPSARIAQVWLIIEGRTNY